ncbi:hypothetical protein [Lysinibacillus pakistanensis]|uniref:Uncharacterized protein n=1 Tax=Lysinibacillus pakistanensis TaxID=759811 RepID=A0AAX3X189_9BACI|nr:hypothetical protein [Lysinibacillus pakistanensis]MDM5232517.1 hypothetical protein [Lysinibacillus pakistanensis]WHY48026.1 hypothetical protein QNH22_07300 [Lysinibacillus pakistanensis]WHY53038.1 hypothetical protein QNH24_07285 [Lysinibacillus pakistanensis]
MNSNNISNKAVILAEDKLYQKRKDIVKTIEEIYSQLDHDLKTIMDMRYWDNERNCY